MTRARSRGFTLMELMIVVMLVAILAMIAAPSMSTARNDRIAFDYARQTSGIFHEGRARAAGRGGAHLALFTTAAAIGTRGAIFLFEGLDGTAPPAGPSPIASCRSATQWNWAATYVPGVAPDATNRARLIEFLNINATATGTVQVSEDIFMRGFTVTDAGAKAPVTAIAVCTTPNGTTYVGTGATGAAAITAMTTATPFTGIAEVDVARHRSGGLVVAGLTRRVMLAGAGAPRILSQ